MPFLSLPNELLLQIADDVLSDPDWTEPAINSLARANKHLYDLLNDRLYQNNIQFRGSIALLWAVRRGREGTVRRLLHFGANVSMTIEGHAHFRNAHIYTKTQPYETPLHAAVRDGNLTIVKLLLDAGAAAALHLGRFTDWTPLFAAIDEQREEIAHEIYIAMGAIPLSSLPTLGGLTPLHSACRFDMPDLVRLFLEMGADVDLKDGKSRTPLYHALYCNQIRVVHLLLDYGADFNLVADARETYGRDGQSRRLWRRYKAENPYDDRVRKLYRGYKINGPKIVVEPAPSLNREPLIDHQMTIFPPANGNSQINITQSTTSVALQAADPVLPTEDMSLRTLITSALGDSYVSDTTMMEWSLSSSEHHHIRRRKVANLRDPNGC